MSKQETKDVNEMDAAEMLAAHQQKHQAEDHTGECEAAEHWAQEMIREFNADAKRWHRQQGVEAFGLALLAGVTAASCAAALISGLWKPIVAGIGLVNLMMAGAWMHKAKAGWSA